MPAYLEWQIEFATRDPGASQTNGIKQWAHCLQGDCPNLTVSDDQSPPFAVGKTEFRLPVLAAHALRSPSVLWAAFLPDLALSTIY